MLAQGKTAVHWPVVDAGKMLAEGGSAEKAAHKQSGKKVTAARSGK